jgi:hypothetical protein
LTVAWAFLYKACGTPHPLARALLLNTVCLAASMASGTWHRYLHVQLLRKRRRQQHSLQLQYAANAQQAGVGQQGQSMGKK